METSPMAGAPRHKVFREACNSDLGLPAGTFIYSTVAVHPFLVSTGSYTFVVAVSDDSLRWISYGKMQGKALVAILQTQLQAHSGLTCLHPCNAFECSGFGTLCILTAGRDGMMKLWHSDGAAPIMHFAMPNEKGVSAVAHCSSIHQGDLFAAGTELFEENAPGDVAVYVWSIPSDIDTKHGAALAAHSTPILAIIESHTDTITNLAFHTPIRAPDPPSDVTPMIKQSKPVFVADHNPTLLTTSTDGLINLINTSQPDEDDAVLAVLNNRSAVQHFKAFTASNSTASSQSLLDSGHVVAISQDEKLSVHAIKEGDVDAETSDPRTFDLREVLGCDYVVGLRGGGVGVGLVLVVGAFKPETTDTPRVDLYTFKSPPRPSEMPELELVARLEGAHGEEIVRDVWFHEEVGCLLTCGEDGCVRVWEEEEPSSRSKGAERVMEKEGKVSRKKKWKEGKESRRFKPY